ncbi:MAG: nickel-dependent lactate racemase [Actinobacteria bacterium]|nr:nickel-dependent lactate racemase [Actinomycetota bacterium]
MQLKYGKGKVEFDLPQNIQWQVLHKNLPFLYGSEDQTIDDGIYSLVKQLSSRVAPKAKLLFIVPDHTRRCRLEIILPKLTQELEQKFNAQIEILIANGSHVLQPEHVIRDLVGEAIYKKYPVQQHDCHDEKTLHDFGKTTAGTPVRLNSKVKEADFIITIGGVLYHYFAGFGGGPKMLLPGVAAYETIRMNHRRTIDPQTGRFHSHCHEGNITTNPVYLDLAQVIDFVPNCLSLQVALDFSGHVIHAAAGPILETQKEICSHVADVYSLPLEKPADIVVASAGGFPSDVNLIQAHKSIHHAFQAVKKGGHIIVLAECSEGIGSKSFLPYFEFGAAENIGRQLLRDYQINGHTALALKSKAEQVKVILVSSLEKEIVKKTGMIPVESFAVAWKIAEKELDAGSAGYIIPKASVTVPIISKP